MRRILALAGAVAVLSSSASATVFSGNLFYTTIDFGGAPNVHSVTYSYNDGTTSLTMGAQQNIAALNGADGIIFDTAGRLLIGGGPANEIYRMNTNGTGLTTVSLSSNAFHVTLSPDGSTAYTSPFSGNLQVVPLAAFTAGTAYGINGGDTAITQLSFGPTGQAFYINGAPNGNGNFGTIDISNLSNIQTTRLYTGLLPAHGMVYDGYTNRMTMFGAGAVATVDSTTGGGLLQRTGITCDFDQGSVDGQGHAFIAGCDQLTFIDYRASGDITNPLNPTIILSGYEKIDDLAPLSGAGSQGSVPEPGTVVLLAGGLAVLALRRRA